MKYTVIYDITDDNLRSKMVQLLTDYGLERIQYSAFFGELKTHVLRSLIADIRQILSSRDEYVLILPVCNKCYSGKKSIGKPKKYKHIEKAGVRPSVEIF